MMPYRTSKLYPFLIVDIALDQSLERQSVPGKIGTGMGKSPAEAVPMISAGNQLCRIDEDQLHFIGVAVPQQMEIGRVSAAGIR